MLSKLVSNSMYKVSQLVQTIEGWLIMFASFLLAYVGEGITSFYVMATAVLLDSVLGICSAIKRGEFAFSYLAREMFPKLAIYTVILILIYMTERTLPINHVIATPIISAAICSIELWSILAHVRIIKPDLALGILLSKHLEGEIARKLGVTGADVKEALNKRQNQEQ